MKKMLKSFGIAAVAAVIGFGFASCEGPAGLQGTQGPDGRAANRLVFDEPTEYFYRASFATGTSTETFLLTGFFGVTITYTEFRYDAPITGVYGNLVVLAVSGDDEVLEVVDASITIDRNGLVAGSVELDRGSDFPSTGTAAVPVTVTVSAAGLPTASLSVVLLPANMLIEAGTIVVERDGTAATNGVSTAGVPDLTITLGAAPAGIGANLNDVTITIPITATSLGIDNWRLSGRTLDFVQLVSVVGGMPTIGTGAAETDAFTISGTLNLTGPGGSTPATPVSALVLAFEDGITGAMIIDLDFEDLFEVSIAIVVAP